LLLNSHNYGDHFSRIFCLFRRSNINFVLHKGALLGRVLRSPTAWVTSLFRQLAGLSDRLTLNGAGGSDSGRAVGVYVVP
jgi:hypothetical protein